MKLRAHLTAWRRRLFGTLRKAVTDRDATASEMDEEMRSHIEMKTQANIDAGMDPGQARQAAARSFGAREAIKEQCREKRGVAWLENLARDVRFGARQLFKNLGFTVIAALTLALGIGANTVVFSVVKPAFFRPLGFEEEDRLVWFDLW